jgi:MFS family permease
VSLGLPGIASVAAFRGWRALQHRNYRLWFSGQAISVIGTWMQMVAQSWLVLSLTGDPFMLGLVAAAQYSPVLAFGLFGGLVADNLPKRRILIGTQAVMMTMALILFVLTATHLVQVWHVLLVALGLGMAQAIDMPTRNSFSVEMVGREDVANAVALNSALFNGARILGPAVAGLTIGAFDISVAFLINGLSFVGVLAGLVMMSERELRSPPPMPRPSSVRGALGSLAEGLGYVRRTPLVLLAVVTVGLVSTFGMNWTVLIPSLARDVLGTDASGYGFLMSASGIGAFLAALWIAFSRRSRPVLIGVGALVLGSLEIVLGISRVYPLSLLAMLIVGIGSVAMTATANTTVQLNAPEQLRGRVMSVYMTIYVGATPIGSLIMGALASQFGTAFAVGFGGLMSAIAAGVAIAWYRRIRVGSAGREEEPGATPGEQARSLEPDAAPSGHPGVTVAVSPVAASVARSERGRTRAAARRSTGRVRSADRLNPRRP